MRLAFSIVMLIAALGLSSHAKATYCPETGTAREQALCTDATLTAYDIEMRSLFDAAIQALPSAEASRLKRQQEDWLKYLDRICPESVDDFASCLIGQYISRVRALKAAAARLGPYLFTRIDVYQADRLRGGATKAAEERHAAYPSIADPKTDAERAWNALQVRKPERADCEGRHGDTDVDYEIHLATAELIGVVWTEGYYCHGAPHPYAVTTGRTMILHPAPRLITASDLFVPDSDWSARLDRAVRDGVAKAALEKAEEFDPARLDGYAAEPSNWILSQDGLVVFFNPRHLGSPGFTPSILVPWSDIADILRPGLDLPPT